MSDTDIFNGDDRLDLKNYVLLEKVSQKIAQSKFRFYSCLFRLISPYASVKSKETSMIGLSGEEKENRNRSQIRSGQSFDLLFLTAHSF